MGNVVNTMRECFCLEEEDRFSLPSASTASTPAQPDGKLLLKRTSFVDEASPMDEWSSRSTSLPSTEYHGLSYYERVAMSVDPFIHTPTYYGEEYESELRCRRSLSATNKSSFFSKSYNSSSENIMTALVA
eukprot:GILK01003508.1.p1 GENE.GILK01003508.1~~GILK01003508.1.p1  ORF type:complete len:131 (-),score=22.11 GILK01003508.1:448-840(-)